MTPQAQSTSATSEPTREERRVLQELARRKREIGLLPVQQERQRAWTDLNGLRPVRPMVWINEIPWPELEAADPAALQARCRNPVLRAAETELRRELYQWDHFQADMIVDPFLVYRLVGGPDGSYADYGLKPKEIRKKGAHDVLFQPRIESLDDVQRIHQPRVWVDHEKTERRRKRLEEALEGAIPVVVRGLTTQWHTPWDYAVRWYGVERLMYDLIDRPELVAATCERVCQHTLAVLDEQERLGMLAVGNGNWRVGSGGLGCTDELPSGPLDRPATARDQWGCGNAQIFSEVSASMHEEFSLRFERPVIERFGLSYYGCCEPLHRKIPMLRSLKNLRKISMSPKANLRQAADTVGRDYVLSFKPNPAHVAGDAFDAPLVRAYLRQALKDLRGSPIEIIFKDITTIRSDPQRLHAWERIAMEVAMEVEAEG